MVEAQRVVEIIRKRLTCSSESLHVLWFKTDADNRDHFAKQLRDGRGDVALVPIVVREPIFVDPNSVLSDLNRVLLRNRHEIEGLDSKALRPVVIVMLSRVDANLSQTASPIQLPDWFPHLGGTEIYVRVRDLLTEIEAIRFNAPEARADDLAAHLHRLETAIVVRLETIYFRKPQNLDSIWTALAELRKTERSQSALRNRLADYRSHVNGLTEPRAYRPSLKTEASILSDLLTLIQRSTPDQLVRLAKSVVIAMGVTDKVTSRLPMIAILLRPTMPMDAAVRFCHTLLASVYGGYQFLNATAHASDYPMVSVAFLRLNSRDLRLALQHLADQMDRMA